MVFTGGGAMNKSDKKLAELILYVSRKSETDKRFGSVKLNKILFYADFTHYGETGSPITGAEYMKLKLGPGPRRLMPIRDELIRDDSLAIQEVRYRGWLQKRTVALREPDLSAFSGTEIAIVDEVIEDFWEADGKMASDFSHEFLGWKIANDGDEIPYESVFVSERTLTSAEKDHALELVS